MNTLRNKRGNTTIKSSNLLYEVAVKSLAILCQAQQKNQMIYKKNSMKDYLWNNEFIQ